MTGKIAGVIHERAKIPDEMMRTLSEIARVGDLLLHGVGAGAEGGGFSFVQARL